MAIENRVIKNVLKVGGFILICIMIIFVMFIKEIITIYPHSPGCKMKLFIKVVDQFGNGVHDFKLHVIGYRPNILYPIMPKRYTWQDLVTDKNGYAFYQSKNKETLILLYDGVGNESHIGKRKTVVGLSCEEYYGKTKQPVAVKSNDKNHPLIYPVYKHGPKQKLIKFSHSNEGLKLDSRKYLCLDMMNGIRWFSDRPEGNISVLWLSKERYKEITETDDIICGGIEIIANGDSSILNLPDKISGYDAPKNGYKKVLIWPRDWPDGDDATRDFYFILKNIPLCGRLHIYIAGCNEFCKIDYLVNPNGSRNFFGDEPYGFLDKPWTSCQFRTPMVNKDEYLSFEFVYRDIKVAKDPQGHLSLITTYDDNLKGQVIKVISGNDCEISFCKDKWGVYAPENGYVKELNFPWEWSYKDGKDYSYIQFYYRVKLGEPKEWKYGRFTLVYDKNRLTLEECKFEYYTNYSGGRDLHFTPDGYPEKDREGVYPTALLRDLEKEIKAKQENEKVK